jgi:thioredoxin 1
MKRTTLLTVATILFATILSLPAQVNFREVVSSEEMDKVWADAAGLNKPVFVDIYATWCGPCKWMDANVFASEEAGGYMNNAFINVKMDGESEFGRQFAMQSGLTAYPSFFIFNSERQLMNMLVGAKPWEELKPGLTATVEYYPVVALLQNKFESGILERREYPGFIQALRKLGKDDYGVQVAATYEQDFVSGSQRTVEDLQVLAFYTAQQTENWTHLTADIPALKNAMEGDLEEFIDYAVMQSIESAVENDDIGYVRAMNALLPGLAEGTSMEGDDLAGRSYIYYYHYTGQFDALISFIDTEYAEKRQGDHAWLFDAAANAVFLDPQNEVMTEKGLEWFSRCLEMHQSHEYYYHLALCQYFSGSKEQTVETLKRALEFTDDPEEVASTEGIIQQVEDEIAGH